MACALSEDDQKHKIISGSNLHLHILSIRQKFLPQSHQATTVESALPVNYNTTHQIHIVYTTNLGSQSGHGILLHQSGNPTVIITVYADGD